MKSIKFHSGAQQDLDEAMAHYEQLTQGLGLDLEAEVEAATKLIQQNPAIGAIYKTTAFRYFVIKRFPYVIYYQELDQAIWIPAIAHGSRRPGYWRKRRFEGA